MADVAVTRDFRRLARGGFDGRLPGRCRHDELATELAVHLEHELDLVARERRFVDGGPRRIQQVAMIVGVSELVPQHPRRMRNHRIEDAQQDRQPLVRQRRRARRIGRPPLRACSAFHPAETTVLYWTRS